LIKTFYPPFGTEKEGELISVSISPETKDIACGAWTNSWEKGGVIYIFDYETTRIKETIRIPNVSHHMQYSSSGKYLVVSLALGNGLQLYDGRHYTLLDHAKEGWKSTSYWCDIDVEETKIIAGSKLHGLYLYEINNDKLELVKHEKRYTDKMIYNVVFSNNGEKIAITFLDENQNKIEVLSSDTFEMYYSLNTTGVKDKLVSVAWSGNDKTLYAAGENEGRKTSLYYWEHGGRGKRESIPLNTEWIDHLLGYQNKIIYSSYDPVWGIIEDNREVYRNESSCVGAKKLAETFEINKFGTVVKFRNSQTDEYFFFDVMNRQLISEAYYQDHFEYLPPITSTLDIVNWKDSNWVMLNGELLPKGEFEKSKVLSINPVTDQFLIGTEWNLICYNTLCSAEWSKTAPSIPYYVNTVKNGEQYVAIFGDGTIRWYRATDGELLLNLYIDQKTNEWILWTQNGYYACSKGMDKQLKWRMNTDKDNASLVYPFSQYAEKFHNTPLTIMTLFENKSDMELLYERDQLVRRIDDYQTPPEIKNIQAKEKAENSVQIIIEAATISACSPIVYINEKRQNDITFTKEGTMITIETGLVTGTNKIAVQLKTESNILSEPKFLTLNGRQTDSVHRNLYLLAIGVNEYQKQQPLNYCINDAEKTAQIFEETHEKTRKIYNEQLITDENFNESTLNDYIASITGQIKKDDIFIFYYSGHGISNESEDNKYSFSMITAAGEYLPFQKLQEQLETIKAQNMLIMIDACQSGVLADTITKGIFEDEMVQLNRKTGINVFTSSQSRESSEEINSLKHGLFTYSLLNSFYSEDDELISIHEIASNLKEQVEITCEQQEKTPVYPKILMTGHDFIVGEK